MELLFDIGGTNSRIGISEDGQTLTQSELFKIPADFETAAELLTQRAAALAQGRKIDLAVMGLAAPLTSDKTELVHHGNLNSWYGKPVKKIFTDKLSATTHLENDAILAGLGEAGFGAGYGHEIVGYLTFSTGVGGANIINGQVAPRRIGFEPCYMVTHANLGNPEEHGQIGDLLNGWSIEERYGRKAEEITDPEVWSKIARLMAITINNSIALWSPDIVVIGGGLTKNVSLEEITKLTSKLFRAYPIPPIKLAQLGDFGGLYGGMQYAKQLTKQLQS